MFKIHHFYQGLKQALYFVNLRVKTIIKKSLLGTNFESVILILKITDSEKSAFDNVVYP